MEIIRIPTSYALQIKHLSEKDIAYVMKSIFLLSTWEMIEIEDNLRWWLVQSIWREIIQLENKARAKKWEEWLSYQLATQGATSSIKTCDQTKPNQTNSSQIKSIQISKETEQAPRYAIVEIEQDEESKKIQKHLLEKTVEIAKETYWKEELNLMQWYLRQAVWVTQFKDSKERWYVQHCYNLMKKIGKDEFNLRLKEILSDQFKAKNCNKLAYLYGELKSFIHSPVVEPTRKERFITSV